MEDEAFVLGLLSAYLEKEGFRVSQAASGAEMMAIFSRCPVDAILLDLNLPDEDGLALARMVRAHSSIPLIVLNSRTGREDRLAALESGADDYLAKPVDPTDLVSRVRNRLNRCTTLPPPSAKQDENGLTFAGWRLLPARRALVGPIGDPVPLSPAEFNLLAALVQAAGRVLSRHHLLDAVSGVGSAPSERMIDVLISRLRQKIEIDRRSPRMIVTVVGHGYKLDVPVRPISVPMPATPPGLPSAGRPSTA